MIILFLCCALFIPFLRYTKDGTPASCLHQSLLYTLTNVSPLSEYRILPPTLFTYRICKISKISQRGSDWTLNEKSVCLPFSSCLMGDLKVWGTTLRRPKGRCGTSVSHFLIHLCLDSPIYKGRKYCTQCQDVCWESPWRCTDTADAGGSSVCSISVL